MLKISVITVCFNSANTIEDTVKSVISQTYKDIEYIVIDGGSTDQTLELLSHYKDNIDVMISEADNGIYDAMNKGIALATGDVVGILNSDDMFASGDSLSQIATAFTGPDVHAVYADLVYVDQYKTDKMSRFYSSKVFSEGRIRFGIMLPHPTFYVRKSVLDSLGEYKTDYRVAADFEFITRFFVRGYRAKRLPSVLVKMREGGISSRGLAWRVHQNFEIVRACRENGIATSIFLVMLKLPYKLFTLMTRWLPGYSQ